MIPTMAIQAKKSGAPRLKILDSTSLRSLYRLVLRASAASVGHHPGATRSMRKLYRPVLDTAHEVVTEAPGVPKPAARETWLKEFDTRGEYSFLVNVLCSKLHLLPGVMKAKSVAEWLAHRCPLYALHLFMISDSYLYTFTHYGASWRNLFQ